MRYKFAFEKLDVWQLVKNIPIKVYETTNSFPSSEKYGIISQINRAVLSVPANISEGSSRMGSKNKSRFYSIAYSSLMELISHLIIAKELGFLSEERYYEIKDQIYEVSNKLNALYKSEKRTTKHLNNKIRIQNDQLEKET